jgi:uncharacterized cupin superfamily protein
MSERAQTLSEPFIRNVHEPPLELFMREPLYESERARVASGTAAKKLGAALDVVSPGKRLCPVHLHRAQE